MTHLLDQVCNILFLTFLLIWIFDSIRFDFSMLWLFLIKSSARSTTELIWFLAVKIAMTFIFTNLRNISSYLGGNLLWYILAHRHKKMSECGIIEVQKQVAVFLIRFYKSCSFQMEVFEGWWNHSIICVALIENWRCLVSVVWIKTRNTYNLSPTFQL